MGALAGGDNNLKQLSDSGGIIAINPATEDKQDDIITELKLKADLAETQPVSNASLPLPAGASTEEKQDDLISSVCAGSSKLVITNAINETAFDLNAAAFSEITSISNDYILDNIEFNFSTEEEKTISVVSSDGTTIWEETNTNKSVHLSNMNIGFNGGENITVTVTQFSSAGTMDCILKVKQGAEALTGDPTVTVINTAGTPINPSTEEKQDDIITELEKKADLTETQPVSLAVSPTKVDETNNVLEIIDSANAKTHESKHFKTGYMDEDLDDTDTLEILFVTPNTTEWAHWSLTSEVVGYAKVEIFEGAVTTDDGTAITRLNRNRNSLIESSTLAYHTPTVTTDGTKIVTKFLGSVAGKKESVGDNFVASNHFLLKQDTKYLLRMTSKLNNTIAKVGGDWYEHINLI